MANPSHLKYTEEHEWIKVEGDVSKMLMLPSVMPTTDLSEQVAAEIRSITLLQ